MLESQIQIVFDARDGMHTGPGRSGHYLFSPKGAGEMNYSIWDDGFGKEVNAEYIGQELEDFTPLMANIYHIYVENETYLAGGTATLDMTYWIEPTSGIVLDVRKELVNWRPQDARRLPLDTAAINKTVTLNVTISAINPIDDSVTPMEIYVEQMVNCSGYTNMTYGVAKLTETVTRYLPDGTMMAAPEVAKFGVDSRTMEYIDVDDWSTVDRTGVYTFPIGLLNETGEVTPTYLMYNSDLGMSFPVELVSEMEMGGLNIAKYAMELSMIPLTYEQVTEVLGQDPGLPGATGTYGCVFEYYVDVNSGTIVNITRSVFVHLVPPTYEFLYDNMDSELVFIGEFGGENITGTTSMIGEDAGEGFTKLYFEETYKNETGEDFIAPTSSNVTINTLTHEVVNETFEGQGHYVLFPPNPMQRDNYTQFQSLGPEILMGVAVMGESTDTTVVYNWTAQTMVDGGLFNPMLEGTNWTLTVDYNYLLDKFTGAILDASVEILLENTTLPMSPMYTIFLASEEVKGELHMSNMVIGWALSGIHKPVMEVQMDLYDMEADQAVMKAMATSQLLLVADGEMPALHLELFFNETTKAAMLQTAIATKTLLDQIPALIGAHMLNDILDANGNKVLHVYYKKVDEDVEVFDGVDGSVKYWADKAKESDEEYERMGVVLPTILYVLGGIGLVIGIVLILAKGKRTEEAEE
jgi:hypothetical protein